MKLIIESGSTKTDWRYKNLDGKIKSARSIGINPTLQSSEEIKDEQDDILRNLEKLQIKEVAFYGAGCGDKISKEKIESILKSYFPEANIQVESDLMAAYKALFENKNGIVCILGTGSNSALFENEKITDCVKSLGYLMGDEGSGTQIGKVLMQDYLRGKAPLDIYEFMNSYFGKTDEELIKEIYGLKYPNRFFAGLVKDIISKNKNHYINELIEKQLHLFFHNCLLQYKSIHKHEIGFVGSIAFYFQDILKSLAQQYGLSIKNIIKQPIDQLILLDN